MTHIILIITLAIFLIIRYITIFDKLTIIDLSSHVYSFYTYYYVVISIIETKFFYQNINHHKNNIKNS